MKEQLFFNVLYSEQIQYFSHILPKIDTVYEKDGSPRHFNLVPQTVNYKSDEPRHEKTCLLGLRPG